MILIFLWVPGWGRDGAACQHDIRAPSKSTTNPNCPSPLVEHPNTPHRPIYMRRGRGTTHNLLERVDGWDVIIKIYIIEIDTLIIHQHTRTRSVIFNRLFISIFH